MILAKLNGEFVKPSKGITAQCPVCKEEVIAKCGSINIWHWSHKNDSECDSWSEPETEWHYKWKTLFPLSCVEVSLGEHRADVQWLGRVIEFQHSNISGEDIQERERFYGNMIWVVDAAEFEDNLYFNYNDMANYCRWKWFRKTWKYALKPVFFQLSNTKILRINKWTHKGFYYTPLDIIDFKKQYLNLKVL